VKLLPIFLFFLATGCFLFAQKKQYLISPNQEVLPIEKGENIRQVIENQYTRTQSATKRTCVSTYLCGFTPNWFWTDWYHRFGGYHRDAFGEWFIVPYTGTIDTVFFFSTYDSIGALDSLLFIRIHESKISPAFGPGIRPGPYNPPCQNWGYWLSTNDFDQGITPFPEEATDTTWISTIAGSVPSRPPIGNVLWGAGGYPLKIRPYECNAIVLADVMPLSVSAGDAIFISMQINGKHIDSNEVATRMYVGEIDSRLAEFREYYPSRIWKFYEHVRQRLLCGDEPSDTVLQGWVARGSYSMDSLTVAYYPWWYSITVTDNTPPTLVDANWLRNTYDTLPQRVTAEIEDCDPSNPAEAGVATVTLNYTATNQSTHNFVTGVLPMTNTGGNTWEGDIPGQQAWTEVAYSLTATDTKGLSSTFPLPSYRVVAQENEFAKEFVDTAGNCVMKDISTTGIEIPSSAFFNAYGIPDSINPKDDGTAGPFALSSPFYLYGERYDYVWVGVNGAITLTKSATDTNDVNANGKYTTGWTFPGSIRTTYRDTEKTGTKPKNFIAPLWSDLFYGTGAPDDQYGHIYYQSEPDEFTVQWGPGIGIVTDDRAAYLDDAINFRVILSLVRGTITFQYQNLGNSGLETLPQLSGFSTDTTCCFWTAPWFFVSKDGQPSEFSPANGKCETIYQKGPMFPAGWNLVSLSVIPLDSNYNHDTLFPNAASHVFRYGPGYGYTPVDDMDDCGAYWIKFSGAGYYFPVGTLKLFSTCPLNEGWNLIGTLSCPVPTGTITEPALMGKTYFGFSSSGYCPVTTLEPGHGYWVKSDASVTLTLICGVPLVALKEQNYALLEGWNTMNLRDARGGEQTLYLGKQSALQVPLDRYELPPLPPENTFDARFSSGRNVETYTEEPQGKGEYTIRLQTPSYPVTVNYSMPDRQKLFTLTELDAEGRSVATAKMNGSGLVRITNPSVTTLKVSLSGNTALPKAYGLSQNYPNPFNPVTRFTVDIPVTGPVDISVYDLLGHKLTTLMSGTQDAGSYTIEWDGTTNAGLSSPTGLYFVKMTAGKFSEARKVLLMK